jgi:ubiquitin carboxyl-terminal hydrolase L3
MTEAAEEEKEFQWPPLESNPEIFTEYMHRIGLSPTCAIGEVFGFDEDLLAFLPQPIYGVIVAFERIKNDRDKGSAEDVSKVQFYMDQTGSLDNACGIIACLHASLNAPVDILPDSVLDKFQKENATKSPAERCVSLEQNNGFKNIHKGFAMKGQSQAITSNQDNVKHHFVAFVVMDGKLIELDGTKKGPNVIGDCEDVLRGSIAEIQKRLAAGEISDQLSMMTLNAAAF